MAVEKTIRIGDTDVTVRELTIEEVDTWWRKRELLAPEEIDLVGEHVLQGCTLFDLAHVCDRTVEQLRPFTPSELQRIVDAGKELMPGFFRLAALGLRFRDSVAAGLLSA